MIRTDEDALICDFAETYHILDYRSLSPIQAATYACGLRENSRIKMKMNHQKVSFDTILLAGIADRLSMILWAQSKNASKGTGRPKMIVDDLIEKKPKESDVMAFESFDDFEKMRLSILQKE